MNKTTTNNDHNVLSLACAGGHTEVVELLLAYGGDPSYKLKVSSIDCRTLSGDFVGNIHKGTR